MRRASWGRARVIQDVFITMVCQNVIVDLRQTHMRYDNDAISGFDPPRVR
jgi:hypothetical protein